MNPNYARKIGVTYGVLAMIFFLLQGIINGGIAVNSIIGVLTFVAMVAVPVVFLGRLRREQDDVLEFKTAFLTGFAGLLIGGIISSVFTLIYVNFLDSNFADRIVMSTLEMQKGFMEGAMSEDQMAEIMQKTEDGIRNGYTFLGNLKTLGYTAIFYLILSLIVAAFVKKKPAEV